MEIATEVTAERSNKDAADVAPLPTSTKAVTALALVHCYCGAIAGTSLSPVDRLDYVEDAMAKHAVANKNTLL